MGYEMKQIKKKERKNKKNMEIIKKVMGKKYLGDIVSQDGTNRTNIKQRRNKMKQCREHIGHFREQSKISNKTLLKVIHYNRLEEKKKTIFCEF